MNTSTGDRIGVLLPRTVSAARFVSGHAAAICTLSLFAADMLAFAAAAVAIPDVNWAIIRRDPDAGDSDRLMLVLDLCLLASGITIRGVVTGRYSARAPFLHEVREIALMSGALVILLCLIALHANGGGTQLRALIATLLLYPFVATGANLLAKRVLARIGAWALPVVVVGEGAAAAAAEAALLLDKSLGYHVVRRVDATAMSQQPLSLNGQPATWRAVLQHYHARCLVVAADSGRGEASPATMVARDALFGALMRERVPFTVLADAVAVPVRSHRVTQFFGHDATLVSYRDRISQPLPRLLKAVADVILAALLLVLTAPLFLSVALAGLLDGGPILFAHERVGAGGRRFHCLKFRTMAVDCDRVLEEALARDPALALEWHATHKLRDDPRVTPLGRLLRKTSLDELPQLFNVLRLEMSLVGPRPIVESEIARYGDDIAHYYAARPGLTGLWQVSGRSNTTYARRVQLDVWYVQNWTLWNDFLVLAKTLPAVLLRDGAV